MKAFNLHVGVRGGAEKEACIGRRERTRGSGNKQAEAQKRRGRQGDGRVTMRLENSCWVAGIMRSSCYI